MLTQEPQWVAAYTAPRAEKAVTARIAKELQLETYLPLHHVLRKWSDRIKSVEVPLIPSYTFVKLREADLFRVREIVGLTGFVTFRETGIATIPEREIENLRRLAESMQAVHVYNTDHLKKGAHVAVVAGEFKGMQGAIVSNCKDGNFSVEIDKLNFSLVITLESDVLQVID
jgi:transcription antitermination factor NusG